MAVIELKRPIILATASEARRKLMADTGLSFITDMVEVDESPWSNEKVSDYVGRVALAKAEAVIPAGLDAVIIAVDTAIGLGDEIIGKPRDESHAREILSMLSGQSHEVASTIVVKDLREAEIQRETTLTSVKFAKLTDEMIDWYLGTGEWKGRAGAYAIQGRGAALVSEVHGCFTNVIGMSLPALIGMLKKVRA